MEEEKKELGGLSRNKKIALAVAGGLVGLIVLVYLGLCVYVGASRAILPGVWTKWAELSGMTQEEATSTLDAWVEQVYADAQYDLSCEDSVAQLSGNIARVDGEKAAEEAYMVGRSEPFLKRGAVIFAHLLGVKTMIDCPVELNDAGAVQLERAVKQLSEAEATPLVETVWSLDGDKLVITHGATGVRVDREQAEQALLAVMQHPGERNVIVPVKKTEPTPLDLQQVHDQIHTQAADAYVQKDETGNVTVVPHVVGIDFDVPSAQAQVDALGDGATLRIGLTVTMPAQTENKVRGLLFADVLSECTTYASGTEYRLNNVAKAAQAMDGLILLPGEVFSYNDTLGPRTVANGYKAAPAYIGGKTVDEVGGGICQNSSTLYLAVLKANLEIVERTNHMYTVGYVPDGLDATVAYNALDFKFRNNTDYPIRIESKLSGRNTIIKLYGTDTRHQTVKMETKLLSSTPYAVTYKPDSSVAVGKTVVDTTAYTGKKVQVFRCVYNSDGELISRTQESMNNYRRRDKVILYNPADAEKLGLVGADGKVHTTVQPKPEPAPVVPEPPKVEPEQPKPEAETPVIEPQPEPEVPAVEPQPVPEQETPAVEPQPEQLQPEAETTAPQDAPAEGV